MAGDGKIVHRYALGSEPKVQVANLCKAYDIKCFVRGGQEICTGLYDYDPEVLNDGTPEDKVLCICPCHKKPAEA